MIFTLCGVRRIQGKANSMSKFEPYHCQMDYETNIVEIQYDGDSFDAEKAIDYAKES